MWEACLRPRCSSGRWLGTSWVTFSPTGAQTVYCTAMPILNIQHAVSGWSAVARCIASWHGTPCWTRLLPTVLLSLFVTHMFFSCRTYLPILSLPVSLSAMFHSTPGCCYFCYCYCCYNSLELQVGCCRPNDPRCGGCSSGPWCCMPCATDSVWPHGGDHPVRCALHCHVTFKL